MEFKIFLKEYIFFSIDIKINLKELDTRNNYEMQKLKLWVLCVIWCSCV